MSDVSSFAEINGQHAELLPDRTVLSLFSTQGGEIGGGGIGGGGGGELEFVLPAPPEVVLPEVVLPA